MNLLPYGGITRIRFEGYFSLPVFIARQTPSNACEST